MQARVGANSFPQRSLKVREQSTGKQTTDPLAMKKEFGEKNLAEILNTVADPNYKASQRKIQGVGNAEMGKDAFFKLMLTQLKQQDPTNPLKSHEMAAQLAQFSSVEQLTNINETLGKMSQKDQGKDQYDVLNLIGKKVSGDSGQIDRIKGDKEHKVEFQLASNAETATVEIKDNKGIVVKKYELKDLKKGKNQIVWNGLHADGKDARVGQYSAHISAMSRGKKITGSTEFSGAVDGVKFTNKGPVLMVGGKSLNLRDVKQIEESKKEAQVQHVSEHRLDTQKSQGAMVANKDMANLDTAKMDQELRQKLTGKVKGINTKIK